MTTTPTTSSTWTILHVGRDVNNTWKVIARRGAQVLHANRLTETDAASFDQPACDAAWARQIGR